MDAGEWRDSNDGLAGGRIPYDVNAVLVPAALDSAAALEASGLLKPYLAAAMPGFWPRREAWPMSGGPRRRRCST